MAITLEKDRLTGVGGGLGGGLDLDRTELELLESLDRLSSRGCFGLK